MNFFGGVQQIQLRTEGRENGDLGGSSPLFRGFTQFANEQNPYSDYVVRDVYSTELGIWRSFKKKKNYENWRGFDPPPPPPAGKPVHEYVKPFREARTGKQKRSTSIWNVILLTVVYTIQYHSFQNHIHSFISVDPYRITNPLDMESGNNNTKYAKQLQYTGC
jgi:hypothetical protein